MRCVRPVSYTHLLPAYHQDRGEQQLAEDEEKIIEFIQEHPEIDSYFAVEYSLARIVYTCLRKLGLQEKCPVVCFDGSDNIVNESMFTHVKQNEKEIGSLSVRILACLLYTSCRCGWNGE